MLGSKPNIYWVFSWKFLTPVATLVKMKRIYLYNALFNYFYWNIKAVIIIASISNAEVKLDNYRYPLFAHIIGWSTVVICLLPIPLCFIIELFNSGLGKVIHFKISTK